MAYTIKSKRKFGKETYHLSSINRTLDAEPIQEHSAQDWRNVGYKAKVVKKKGYVALYLKPEPKFPKRKQKHDVLTFRGMSHEL